MTKTTLKSFRRGDNGWRSDENGLKKVFIQQLAFISLFFCNFVPIKRDGTLC